MPALSGVCDGCGVWHEGLAQHQSSRKCYPERMTATETWRHLTAAVREGEHRDYVAFLESEFAESLARYR